MRLHSVSLYSNEADVLWLSEGALGPDEHNVVVEAIEYLKAEKGQLYHELGMEDGRIAIFLGIRAPRGDLVGTVMILADMKSMSEGTMERILTVPVKTLMQKMAVYLRKQYPQASDTGMVAAIPAAASGPASGPAPVAAAPAPPASAAKAPAPAAPVLKAAPSAPPPAAKTPPVVELGPNEVDTILTLEMIDEPPAAAEKPAEKPKAVPPTPIAAKAPAKAAPPPPPAKPAPVAKAVPTKAPVAPVAAPAPASRAGAGAKAAPATVSAKPAASAPPPAPSSPADIEVLDFDAELTINSARPVFPSTNTTSSVTDADVLPFDADIQIPTAYAAPPVVPVLDIEVLDFDSALTLPPNTPALAKAAQSALFESPKAAQAAKTGPTRPPAEWKEPDQTYDTLTAFNAGLLENSEAAEAVAVEVAPPVLQAAPPAAEVRAKPVVEVVAKRPVEIVAKTAPPVAAPLEPAAKATPPVVTPAEPVAKAAPPAAKAPTPAPTPAPAPVSAPGKSSSTSTTNTVTTAKAAPTTSATVSVPVLNSTSATASTKAAEEQMLICDTGPVKKLEVAEEAIAEPVPATPPPPPLTVAETATDLMLFVQELIKLRSSGRTKRYEVLARSMRDAGRNEVPTAFLSESTRGRDGSALDALVLERLLQWLGQHGETLWDSEPASFSMNLSIGAIEDEAFPQKIRQWLDQYNVPAEHVGFEISEFACVQCRPAVERFVTAIEELGCFLVIDNFSFDSNMFELLGSKALRHVKIDPKLTSVAMKEKLPQALVVAILQACKVLGVHCVAKRIDGQASLQWLTAVGCDFAQSFQLEKPAPIDRLVTGKSIKALRE